MEYLDTATLDKNLVLDVCEPYMQIEKIIDILGEPRDFFRFGEFSFADSEFIFGATKEQYMASLKDSNSSIIPILFARKDHRSGNYQITPMWNEFPLNQMDIIVDGIQYALYSKQVAAHYCSAHC